MNKNKIIYLTSRLQNAYIDDGILSKIKDRIYTRYEGEYFIKELGINIYKIKFPPNGHKNTFKKNVYRINKKFGDDTSRLAIKTIRKLDYFFYSEFQKKIFAYSVVKSIQLLLMTAQKSINNSCIAVFDGSDEINQYIAYELAKKSKNFILVSDNIRKTRTLCDYIISNFGVSPIVTNDIKFALKSADFVITSKPVDSIIKSPVWYLDNIYIPQKSDSLIVNDIIYSTPWEIDNLNITPELLGAIFERCKVNDIEEFLDSNGIVVKDIVFKNY